MFLRTDQTELLLSKVSTALQLDRNWTLEKAGKVCARYKMHLAVSKELTHLFTSMLVEVTIYPPRMEAVAGIQQNLSQVEVKYWYQHPNGGRNGYTTNYTFFNWDFSSLLTNS